MPLTILDAATQSAVAAATTQTAQATALVAAWAGGAVTARVMAGNTLLSTLTHGAWVQQATTPRTITMGARTARTFAAAGTPTRVVFRSGSTDIFELTAGVGSGDVSFAATISALKRERISGVVITAASSLPVGDEPAQTLTLSASGDPVAGTPYSVTVLGGNLTGPLVVTLENVTGSASFVPATVNPAPGELSKLTAATWAAAGSASIRATSGGIVSNTLAVTVQAAPTPPPPPPAPGSTITSLQVVSTSAGTFPYSSTVLPLRGQVPSGSNLQSSTDTSLRGSILSRHDDGSAAVVVVAGSVTVGANATSAISIQTGTPAPGADLTPAAIGALVSSVSVDFGGGLGIASVTDFSAPDRLFYANANVIAARYRVAAPTPGSTRLEAVVFIRAYAGRAKVRVVVENARVDLTAPTTPASASYSGAVVAVNGSTIATVSGNGAPEGAHAGFRAWMAETWIGGDPGLRVTQSHTDLQQHPLLWKMDQANTASLTSYASDAYTPWTVGRQRGSGMGAGGDHPSIGPLTQWQARALQSGDARAWNATEVSDLALLGFAINHRDQTTGDVPTIASLAGRSMNAGVAAWPQIGNSQNGTMGWEVAHHPAAGLMSFLADPCPVYIEVAQKVAVWNALYSVYVGDGSRVTTGIFGPAYQTRGRAWGMRSLSHATFITPESQAAWKAAAVASLGANFAYLDQYRTSAAGTLNFAWAGSPASPAIYTSEYNVKPTGAAFGAGLWQYCFLIVSLHRAASARLLTGSAQTTANSIADWCATWAPRWVNEQKDTGSWRFIHSGVTLGSTPGSLSTGGFANWTAARAYAFTDTPASVSGVWRTSAVDHPATYADAAFVESTPADSFGYPAQFYSALMAAVERGVSGAATAYWEVQDKITNIAAWRTGMGADGRWNTAPKVLPPSPSFASGSDVGSFNSATDTWTPARTGDVVNAASYASVPSGRWVAVEGTRLDAMTAAVVAVAPSWSASTLAWNGVMNAWNGFAIDEQGARLWLASAGGHADSSNNGVYRFDAFGMKWHIERPPSDRNEWSAQYKGLIPPQPGGYSACYESTVATPQQALGEAGTAGNHYFDVLFWDKRPTSRHLYSSLVYVPQSNELVLMCRQLWRLSLDSKDWTYRRRFPLAVDGAEVYNIYDEVTNTCLFGGAGDGIYASAAYKLTQNEWSSWRLDGAGGAGSGSPWALYTGADVRVGRKAVFFAPPLGDRTDIYMGKYWTYDLNTRALVAGETGNVQFAGGLGLSDFRGQYSPTYDGGCAIAYIPGLNRYWITLLMKTGMRWLQLDPTTTPWTLSPLSFANAPPLTADKPCRKFVYLPGPNAVLYFSSGDIPAYLYKF